MNTPTLVVLTALLVSCGPSNTRVKTRTCAGCLDADDICHTGNDVTAC